MFYLYRFNTGGHGKDDNHCNRSSLAIIVKVT